MNSNMDPELRALFDAVCNETISPDEQATLHKLLSADLAAREQFLDYVQLHLALDFLHRGERARQKAFANLGLDANRSSEVLVAASPLLGFLNRMPAAIQPGKHPFRFLAAATALTVAFWIAVVMTVSPRGPTHPNPPAAGAARTSPPFDAKIVRWQDAVWGRDYPRLSLGSSLATGQMWELRQGLVQLHFGDGAVVALEGPARFQIDSANAMTIERGKLLARVRGRSQGFVVRTPIVQVVDIGTEFGVEAHETKPETEVQVFVGKVEVSPTNGARKGKHELSAGSAALFGNSPQQGFYVQEMKMNRAIYLSLAAVLSLPLADVAQAVPIALNNATASYSQSAFLVAMALDTSTSNGWAISPNQTSNQQAVFQLVDPLPVDQYALAVTMRMQFSTPHLLGKFRLSVTDSPTPTVSSGATWTTLTPDSIVTANVSAAPANNGLGFTTDGSNITLINTGGGSVFPNQADYIFSATTGLSAITGIRLETFPDATFVSSGSGTGSTGNFVLSYIQLQAEAIATPEIGAIPEPASSAMLGLGGMLVLGATRRRRAR